MRTTASFPAHEQGDDSESPCIASAIQQVTDAVNEILKIFYFEISMDLHSVVKYDRSHDLSYFILH